MNEASFQEHARTFPATLLILGTDLAGKDHVANVLTDAASGVGIKVERRRGKFSAPADRTRTSECKNLFSLGLEWLFLVTLPLHCRLLPLIVAALIFLDIRRFHPSAAGSILVVSHTPIRLLAFALGHQFKRIEDIRIAPITEQALRAILPATKARVIALDISHTVRAERMAQRMSRGTVDYFDRYMGSNPVRSERIESILVWIGMTYLNAVHIENNNLSDAELLAGLLGRH